MTRENILDNLDDFSAKQLCEAIQKGMVSLEELQSTGNLDASKRRAIRACLDEAKTEEEQCWRDAQSADDESGYLTYLDRFPNGAYVLLARNAIERIRREHSQRRFERERLLSDIKENPNAYSLQIIRRHLSDGNLDRTNLLDIGIPEEVIDILYQKGTPPNLNWQLGEPPHEIPEGYTEVYFWGIPGSGKTTALSAVLGTADNKGWLETKEGPGYIYMTQLVNLFKNRVARLPPGNNIDDTQYLPFTLKKPGKDKISVSLIELSGEIFQCFLNSNANLPLPTLQHEETFNKLLSMLKGSNRKIHFFFVDYHRSNTADQEDLTQANYLNAAATFFNNSDFNLFKQATDYIYIILTKSDLINGDDASKITQMSNYLNKNYKSFVESLKAKCKEHEINHGRLMATHFSLGRVYFSEICEFNETTALNIIDILMNKIPSSKKNILDVFND